MSVATVLTLMLAFGMYTISLVGLTVSIVVAILGSKKDRQ